MFSVLGLFAVLCRVLALLHRQRTPGYDDYMLFVAYAFSIGFTISSYVSVRWGVGLKLSDAPPSWAVNAIKVSRHLPRQGRNSLIQSAGRVRHRDFLLLLALFHQAVDPVLVHEIG